MLPDWVSNPGPLTYESGALPIAPGPKIINFQFISNGNLMILGVPIFKQIIMRLYSA